MSTFARRLMVDRVSGFSCPQYTALDSECFALQIFRLSRMPFLLKCPAQEALRPKRFNVI